MRKLLSTFEHWIFGSERRKPPSTPARMRAARIGFGLFFIVCSIGLMALFVFASWFYPGTRARIEENPLVTNLTRSGIKAHIRFGQSPMCGETECWLSPGWDHTGWEEIPLPMKPADSLRSRSDYKTRSADQVYYRVTIPVPDQLRSLSEEISFSPLYIQHQYFEVHLNGRLVFTGNGIGGGQIANFPIPRKDREGGQVFVAFKASVTPDDIGITHYSSMLLGPKSVLDGIYVHYERAQFTYFMLFMISKGAIFIIFSLFYFFNRNQTALIGFLVFAFFTTIENLFAGDYLASYLGLNFRVLMFFTSKAIAVTGLTAFVATYLGAFRIRRILVGTGLAISLIVAGLAMDFGWGTKSVNYNHLWGVTNAFLVATVVLSLSLCLITQYHWRKRGAAPQNAKDITRFSIFLSMYLAFIVWEFYFQSYGGFDKRVVVDLAFFIMLALNTAIDMGIKEGRIKTLESHMEEKHRMEIELQEAAEIARAFMPKGPPRWKNLDVVAFHKPLTENSGDWYTFEQSRSGRFYHFIMCDITGHGVQAAIVVSTCKSVLSTLTIADPEALESGNFVLNYVRDLNATLWSNGLGYHVSTLLGLTFEPESQRLYYLSAGHPSPLLIRRDESGETRIIPLISRSNVLGIRPVFQAEMKNHEFKPGDRLISFTDGIPIGSNLKAFKRFLSSMLMTPSKKTLQDLYKFIWESERSKTNNNPNDDVSIVWFDATANEKAG